MVFRTDKGKEIQRNIRVKIVESHIPELIRQGKDKEAIDHLYRQVLPIVKKYIMQNSGTLSDAEDVFQDAVVAFYETVITGKFNEQYKVYGFVYKICQYRWINKEKKDKKISFREDLQEMPEDQFATFSLEEEIEDEANIFKKLFANIGTKCVELLNYTIMKDLLIEDIVIRMGFPSATAVSMQISRCKEKLMLEIQKNPTLVDKLRGV
jgi:RNA polymerase sigma factor (sigma-70 family)